MKNPWLLLFLMLGSNSLAYAGEHPGKNSGISGSLYYPISQNITFIYQSSFGETKSTFTYSGQDIIALNESDRFKYRQSLKLEADGVYVTETYQKIHVFLFINKEANYTYNKPLLRLPFPLLPGKSWTWQGTEYCGNDSSAVTVTGKMFNKEKVIVPAGSFDAIKVVTKIESSSHTKNIITEWFAENVGLVKAEASIEGGGFMGMMRDILGYGKINFELKEIQRD